MKRTLFARGMAALFLALALGGGLSAQSTAPVSGSSAITPARVLPCADAVKAALADAQMKANAECRTIHYCVECLQPGSAQPICKPITANPVCPLAGEVSSPAKMATTATTGKNQAAAVPEPADPFEVIIVQSVCFAGGVTVEPYVTGFESAASATDRAASAKARQAGYTFSWAVDGKKMGTSSRLECVCGKEAVLTATDNTTKKSVTKVVKLPQSCGSEGAKVRVPAPTGGGINAGEVLVAFKRTTCYGTCPAYEVKFYQNGTASWDGYANVTRMGHHEIKLGPDVIAKIQEKAFALKFYDLASKYPTSGTVADAPATITYVKSGTKQHQVENILEAPQKLIDFENFIYDEIVKLGWKADQPLKQAQGMSAPVENPKN